MPYTSAIARSSVRVVIVVVVVFLEVEEVLRSANLSMCRSS
jgi:hypothetical protein